jgi:hypothetical protein
MKARSVYLCQKVLCGTFHPRVICSFPMMFTIRRIYAPIWIRRSELLDSGV